MKNGLFLLLLTFQTGLFANMAEPIKRGTQTSSPFTTHAVDIIHEQLNIHILQNLSAAKFDITYQVQSHESQRKIPMLFYGFEMEEDIEIYVDHQLITDRRFIDQHQAATDSLIQDFSHYFQGDADHENTTNTKVYNGYKGGELAHLYDLVFFEFDLDSGAHTIRVKYTATPWKEKEGWVDKTGFYYSLDPASQWKSFQSLDIQLTHETVETPFFTSLDSTQVIRNSPQKWHFDSLPVPILEISQTPQLSNFAQFITGIGSFRIGVSLFILYGLLIMRWIYHRRKRKGNSPIFSWIALVSTLLAPIFFTLAQYFSSFIVEWSVGEHVTEFTYHGYAIFALFISMPWALGFGVVLFFWDWICRKKWGY